MAISCAAVFFLHEIPALAASSRDPSPTSSDLLSCTSFEPTTPPSGQMQIPECFSYACVLSQSHELTSDRLEQELQYRLLQYRLQGSRAERHSAGEGIPPLELACLR